MTLDELHALANEFFEWPEGSGRQTVTTFSALLFAKHVLEMQRKAHAAENSAGVNALRDAAQQALEALENPARLVPYNGEWRSMQSIAVTALRAALEQEQAEPVQEPVAWMCPDDPERETAFHWQAGHCDNCGKQRIPLYTAPPQRKPLTDEEEK